MSRDLRTKINPQLHCDGTISLEALFFFQAVVVFKSYQYTPLTFGDYNYPDWGIALWWVVCMIPILAIPGWATYRCIAVGVKASTLSHTPQPYKERNRPFMVCPK